MIDKDKAYWIRMEARELLANAFTVVGPHETAEELYKAAVAHYERVNDRYWLIALPR